MQQLASDTLLRLKQVRLYDQFLQKRNCDIILHIGDQQIPAHSCVLAASSPKFDDILRDIDQSDVAGKKEIFLDGFTLSSFDFLIPYIYKGTLNWDEVPSHCFKEILSAAQHYGFDLIVKQIKILEKGIHSHPELNHHFGSSDNLSILKNLVADCFGDAFGSLSQINCMLCSEKLKLNDIDNIIQHCWQHKLTAEGVTEVCDSITEEEEFSDRGTEKLYVNIISDDYKIIDVDDNENELDSDEEPYTIEDFESFHPDIGLDSDIRTTRAENSLYCGNFNLRPTIKASKRRFDYDNFNSSKRKSFTDEFPCPICNKLFKYQKALESHLRFCRTADRFSETDKRNLTKKGLIDNIISGKYSFSTESAKTEVIEYLTSNEPKEKKTWPCPVCPEQIFHKKRDQVSHIKDVHGQIKRFICDHCKKPFPTKTAMYSHMRRHTGEKPFSCPVCNASFAEKKSMEDHARRHTGERPFLCQQCGKDFTFRQSLYRHMKFHEGKRPFQCPQCLKTFVLKQNLQDHIVRHNKQKMTVLKCRECSMTFHDSQLLRKHIDEYHQVISLGSANSRVEVSVSNMIMPSDNQVNNIKTDFVISEYDDEDATYITNYS